MTTSTTAPTTTAPPRTDPLAPVFLALAVGRVVWGATAVAAPRANLRVAGVASLSSPHTDYLIGVFGVRAMAIGLGYLTADAPARSRWRRLGLMIDGVDTVSGAVRLAATREPEQRRAGALLIAVTGAYAAVGLTDTALRLRRLRRPGQ